MSSSLMSAEESIRRIIASRGSGLYDFFFFGTGVVGSEESNKLGWLSAITYLLRVLAVLWQIKKRDNFVADPAVLAPLKAPVVG